MMRFVAPLVVALCAARTTAPQSVPRDAPASVTAPQVKVGDFWEYPVRDCYTGLDRGLLRYEVSHAEANRVVVDVTRGDGQRIDTSSTRRLEWARASADQPAALPLRAGVSGVRVSARAG